MKYIINFQGWCVEVLLEECSQKMYNHFKDNGLNVTDHMCGEMEDELSDEITDGICFDTKFECDNLYHDFGPCYNDSVTIHVNRNHDNVEVYSSDLNSYNGGADCEQDVSFLDIDSEFILMGKIYSSGYISEYILELNDDEPFDHKKLTLLYHDIDEDFQIITGVRYNDVDLECTGVLETTGKGECWTIINNTTGETTSTE